jgi:hypothetical protein
MNVLTEGKLQIKLPAGAIGRKFDDSASHGLSHCMKAVDFIVEMEEQILFPFTFVGSLPWTLAQSDGLILRNEGPGNQVVALREVGL